MNTRLFITTIIVLLLVACNGNNGEDPVLPCNAILTWTAPTTTIDDIPISTDELEKFTIYMSEQPSTEMQYIELVSEITDTNLILWEIKNIGNGTHWFYMTTILKEGNVSPFSEIQIKIC